MLKKKLIAVVYKNAQDFKIIIVYFEIYKAVIDKFGI